MRKDFKIYDILEICEYLEKEKPSKEERALFQREGFRCLGAGERGMGGLSRTAKFVPESIHILVSPVACQRHCDFDLKMNGYSDGVYSLFLTEQEIVGGKVVDVLWNTIEKLLQTLSPQPKVITITTTCVDGLIRSDYTGLKKRLYDEYGIRFGVVEMYPILAESKVKHTDKFPHMVYGLIETDIEKPKKKLVNLLGKIDPADKETDFYKVLSEAGYEVREIRQCQTLQDFDEMGEACLNVVLSEFHLYAAKMMEKKYHIPYFFWNQHMNYETILENYKELEKLLDCKLSVETYYEKAKEKAEKVKELVEGKTFAVGQRIDYLPIKAACDLTAIGWDIRYVFVEKIVKTDLQYYQWLREHSPHTKVLLAPDISMRKYMEQPEAVDVAVGGILALKNVEGLQTLQLPEEPYDFVTYSQAMDQIILQFQPDMQKKNQKNPTVESMFQRQWKKYPKEVL